MTKSISLASKVKLLAVVGACLLVSTLTLAQATRRNGAVEITTASACPIDGTSKLPTTEAYLKSTLIVEPCVVTRSALGRVSGLLHFNKVLEGVAGEPSSVPALVARWKSFWTTNVAGLSTQGVAQSNQDLAIARPKAAQELEAAINQNRVELIAIVNRLDLAEFGTGTAPQAKNLGELRLVYELIDPQGLPLKFSIILEYQIPASDSGALNTQLSAWAKRWKALEAQEFSGLDTSSYLTTLKGILQDVVKPANLLRIRTNEQIDNSLPWEFREFVTLTGRIDLVSAEFQTFIAANAPIHQVPLANTPKFMFKGNLNNATHPAQGSKALGALARRVYAKRSDINSGNYQLSFDGSGRKLSGISTPLSSTTPSWLEAGYTREQFNMAFNTCDGCHRMSSGVALGNSGIRQIFRNANKAITVSNMLYDDIQLITGSSPNRDLAGCAGNSAAIWCSRTGPQRPHWNERKMRETKLDCYANPRAACTALGVKFSVP